MKSVNIKYEIFNDKEHYLAFCAAWKKYYHEMQALKKTHHNPGFADAIHHLLYAILRDRDLTKVFHNKDTMYEHLGSLMNQLKWKNVKYLGRPFGDTLTKEMLLELHDLILGREKAA
jgi:hypothetical protein